MHAFQFIGIFHYFDSKKMKPFYKKRLSNMMSFPLKSNKVAYVYLR